MNQTTLEVCGNWQEQRKLRRVEIDSKNCISGNAQREIS